MHGLHCKLQDGLQSPAATVLLSAAHSSHCSHCQCWPCCGRRVVTTTEWWPVCAEDRGQSPPYTSTSLAFM